MPYIYKRERHDSVLPRRRTHATPSRAGFDSKNQHRLVTVTEYAILHIMSFASIATPSSYQMADEVYTVECRDIARKIEEYNTAVCKFVELGEDAEDGDAAASPKQVCVAHVVVQTYICRACSPPRALIAPLPLARLSSTQSSCKCGSGASRKRHHGPSRRVLCVLPRPRLDGRRACDAQGADGTLCEGLSEARGALRAAEERRKVVRAARHRAPARRRRRRRQLRDGPPHSAAPAEAARRARPAEPRRHPRARREYPPDPPGRGGGQQHHERPRAHCAGATARRRCVAARAPTAAPPNSPR